MSFMLAEVKHDFSSLWVSLHLEACTLGVKSLQGHVGRGLALGSWVLSINTELLSESLILLTHFWEVFFFYIK